MNPVCACHGVPMGWHKHSKYRAGGYWRCRIRHAKQEMIRYDSDPVYRIEKNLCAAALSRRRTIERQREELRLGKVSRQG